MNKANNQSQSDPSPENKFDLHGGIEYGYCTFHGYTDVLFLDDNGDQFHNHYISEDDTVECYGEFVHCEPPPVLTELEWENIFSMEGTV